ncbi:MAG: phosphatidylglycerophosphatase A [Planctomycetota bacterium]
MSELQPPASAPVRAADDVRRVTFDPREILVTFCYCGYAPVASGTAGTLGAVALCLLIPRGWHFGLTALVLAAVFLLIGVALGGWAERRFRAKDPKPFVLDEVMGFFVCVARTDGAFPSWQQLGIAFLLSRFFDILKPFPARRLEKLEGGLGIMGDDFVAAVYAWMALSVLRDHFSILS